MSKDQLPAEPDSVRVQPPIAAAQPDQLAAVARLRGLAAADVSRARVLELACGDGGNLIPLAERYPQATFLGIDPSSRSIASATAEAEALELTNIEFRQSSLLALSDSPGPFDYILAHGVYSWVDAASRQRLLEICRDSLAPDGVAYINYLANPGWQAHRVLGAAMRYEGHGRASWPERMVAGRELAEFLRASLDAESPYGDWLGSAVSPVLAQSDEYVRQQYLRPTHAVYLREFLAEANSHALAYLGDCTAGVRYTDFLHPRTERALDALVTEPLAKEQVRDILQNKGYRQTLLGHQGVSLERTLLVERARGLYLSGRLVAQDPDAGGDKAAPTTFTAADGLSVTTPLPLMKAAIRHLAGEWPGAVEFDQLVHTVVGAAAAARGGELKQEDVQRLQINLLQCCSGGVLRMHGAAPSFVARVSDRPAAGRLARWRSARSDVLTNRKHEQVRLDPVDRNLLQYLDGTRTVSEVIDVLAEAAERGTLVVVEDGREAPLERRREILQAAVPESLERLAAHAFLIA